MEPSDKLEEHKAVLLKFNDSDEDSVAHLLFVKRHRSEKKSSDKPIGKTLTVLNIPPYVTESSLSRVFSALGKVDKVSLIESYSSEDKAKYQIKSEFFQDNRAFKFLIGFVVFNKSQSVDLAFQIERLPSINCEEHPVLTGVAKWVEENNKQHRPNSDDMQKEIDEYMKHYDKVKKQEQMKENEDDDGWVTVGKKGNNAGFKQNESVISKLEQKIQNQKKRNKSLTNFYSFEMRDSKKQQLIDLRQKFEQDKLKMQSMKLKRKFKPYQ